MINFTHKVKAAILVCLISTVSQAQIILDQSEIDFSEAIISGFGLQSNFGFNMADDFTIDEEYILERFTCFGLGYNPNFEEDLQSFKIYFYTDDSGKPSGFPSNPGSEFLLIEIAPDSPALEVIIDPATDRLDFIVDLTLLEEEYILPSGMYWTVASPVVDSIVDSDFLWLQYIAAVTPTNELHIEDDEFTNDTWIPYSGFFGGPPTDLAFLIEGSPTTLGVNDTIEEDDNLEIYPNPAKDYFAFSNTNLSATKVTIMDVTGKIVYTSEALHSAYNEIQIDLKSGLYILNFETLNKNIITRKLIVE